MKNLSFAKLYVGPTFYANDLDAFIPEFWAMESLAVLEESLVATNLVHRDFENTIQSFGDTVNCRRPNRFEPVRKTNDDNVTVQDATAVNVPVILNQHIHTSFIIKDGEESKSMKNLIEEYMKPAIQGTARFMDRMVLGQYGQFIQNQAGLALGMTSSNSKDFLIDSRKKAEKLLWPDFGERPMIVNPDTEALLLKTDLFISAEKVGDNGTALRDASMGKKLGWQILQTQQMANIAIGNSKRSGAVNVSGGLLAGHTGAIVVDGFTGAGTVGGWVNIGGVVDQITAVTNTLGNLVSITLLHALPIAIADDAVIHYYVPGAVNFGAGYASGYSKAITIDAFTVAPQVGQMITFGILPTTSTPVYTVLGYNPSTTSILLDRPLEAALLDDAVVNIGPAGSYSFGWMKNAIALVVRPLAMPSAGTGARAFVANFNGLSIRAVITYDGTKQGHLVTLDLLCGIKVLDDDLGVVMLG